MGIMKALLNLFSRLFRRKGNNWESLNYGKPSTESDDFRNNNNV